MAWTIDLSDKVAVVTGGARGLGFAAAKELCAAGAQTVIADILPDEQVQTALDELEQFGRRPHFVRTDLSLTADCEALIAETVRTLGRVDILVNNAAIAHGDWHKVFDVNVLAHYTLSNAAFEDMKHRGWGKVVNITTSGTFSGGGDGVQYNATKGAADSLTRYLSRRFAEFGVNMNAVAPGPVLTELMENYYSRDKFTQHYLPQMPLKRVLCPADIARVVLFLCSPLSDALCGETILADGGRVRLSPF